MKPEELKEFIEDLRKKGMQDEDLIDAFIKLYVDGKLDLEDLETCINGVGYAMNNEIKKLLQKELKKVKRKKENK